MNLKELSKVLGLSQTTVSRALNGYPEVSEATRARISKAAQEHGYTPSARAKALATGRAFAIGHVVSMVDKYEMVNPVFGDFIAGAGETYAANGYEMILSVVSPDQDEEQAYRALKRRGAVDGVVVQSPRMKDARLALLQDIDMPFVVHGRASGVQTDYNWLDVNNRRAFANATKLLIDLGHRRIALINGPETMDFAHRRRIGFEEAHENAGLQPNPDLMVAYEMTEEMGYVHAARMLSGADAPTAILASSMISALGVRRAIEERGLVMGRDVSVATHDDMLSYLRNGTNTPIFTATRSSVREAGRQLGQMLLDNIASTDTTPNHRLLEAELIIGQSTGPAPTKDT